MWVRENYVTLSFGESFVSLFDYFINEIAVNIVSKSNDILVYISFQCVMESNTHESKDQRMEMQLATEEVDAQCGYTESCRPAWLQRFANAKAFLIVVTAYAFVQGTSKTVISCFCIFSICFVEKCLQ